MMPSRQPIARLTGHQGVELLIAQQRQGLRQRAVRAQLQAGRGILLVDDQPEGQQLLKVGLGGAMHQLHPVAAGMLVVEDQQKVARRARKLPGGVADLLAAGICFDVARTHDCALLVACQKMCHFGAELTHA